MDYRKLVGEAPTTVGLMSSILQSGGSIDTAIRTIAVEGPPLSRILFKEVVRRTDTRMDESLTYGLIERLSSLPKSVSGYSHSIMLVISASDSSDDETRDRMLRDSSEIALESVREMGESFGTSLTFPCMAIFGIGIMTPMIIMSLLPMLNIGGMLGSRPIDERVLMLITLVLIPSIILLIVLNIRRGNPFLSAETESFDPHSVLPLIVSIPLALVFLAIDGDMDDLLMTSVVPACILTLFLTYDRIKEYDERKRTETALMGTVFDIGNRMLSGFNFEKAAVDSIGSNSGCSHISSILEREFALSRGDIKTAVRNTIGPISGQLSSAFTSILLCSEKDTDDAGRMASAIGKQLQNLSVSKKNMELKLKSMTDMMIGTAMFFAPLVLGMSVTMLEPLSRLGDGAAFESTALILGAYLVELSALISILVTSLDGGNHQKVLWRFCLMCPVSLLMFALVCSINI